ncbi:hypothetical protein OE88DRAFT_1689281 [Heliocybe sulcata]|uniref:Fungal-type protein kinase domain-containing protein n=1 Tax=Heliocybe sulcata TaxID=5364 RepID=A0A5C3MML8_9AGAM|nr:hypothetical protein OE88DRAFT_1689281 [Heliocybe sulcata]
METIQTERGMYTPWIQVVHESNFCSGYKFVATPHKGDPQDYRGRGRQVPDVGLYPELQAPQDGATRWSNMRVFVEFKGMKVARQVDGFCDDPTEAFERLGEKPTQTRGQAIGYSEAMLAHQQRTHIFSLQVLGRYARFFRWDKAGAFVSDLVDYVEDPTLLVQFLWRFCKLSDEQQGIDPTAEKIDKPSALYDLMKAGPDPNALTPKQLQYWQDSLREDWPWWKLKVSDCNCVRHVLAPQTAPQSPESLPLGESRPAEKQLVRYFLVAKPHFRALGVTGRGTRGYIAMDPETRRLFYLKDCWRVSLPGIQKEGDVLRALRVAQVEYVPTLVCDGDVCSRCGLNSGESTHPVPDDVPAASGAGMTGPWLGTQSSSEGNAVQTALRGSNAPLSPAALDGPQSTLTDKHARGDSADEMNTMKPHIHYRMVVSEIGQPLDDFEESRQLIATIMYAVVAHYMAYERAGILHRDVSRGNILIYSHPTGRLQADGSPEIVTTAILNDWDLSKDVRTNREGARQPNRTGTWQFMSAALLRNPKKVHQVADDLESFVHVLIYESLRYLRHNCDSVKLVMRQYFDSYDYAPNGEASGGSEKLGAFHAGYLSTGAKVLRFDSLHVRRIIRRSLQWLKRYYVKIYPHLLEPESAPVREEAVASVSTKTATPSYLLGFAQERDSIASLLTSTPKTSVAHEIDVDSEEDEEKTFADLEDVTPIETHTPMIELLYDHLNTETGWLSGDKLQDQLKAEALEVSRSTASRSQSSASKRSASQSQPGEPEDPERRKCKMAKTSLGRSPT